MLNPTLIEEELIVPDGVFEDEAGRFVPCEEGEVLSAEQLHLLGRPIEGVPFASQVNFAVMYMGPIQMAALPYNHNIHFCDSAVADEVAVARYARLRQIEAVEIAEFLRVCSGSLVFSPIEDQFVLDGIIFNYTDIDIETKVARYALAGGLDTRLYQMGRKISVTQPMDFHTFEFGRSKSGRK